VYFHVADAHNNMSFNKYNNTTTTTTTTTTSSTFSLGRPSSQKDSEKETFRREFFNRPYMTLIQQHQRTVRVSYALLTQHLWPSGFFYGWPYGLESGTLSRRICMTRPFAEIVSVALLKRLASSIQCIKGALMMRSTN